MEAIKLLPPMERPREKLRFNGAAALTDSELLAILLGSGTPQVPLHKICETLLRENNIAEVAGMDMAALCQFKGIGPAKATIILAVTEFSRRLQPKGQSLPNDQACYLLLRPLLEQETQLYYILLLISAGRELLAFCEAGSVSPDISWITNLAIKAGASRILLSRNAWLVFSATESRYLQDLRAACAALSIICQGLMAVGPERFKMI